MPTGYISKRSVDAIKPGAAPVFLWDEGRGATKGFGVKVTPAGRRVYIFQYRTHGRGTPKRITIGAHGAWTPEQARDEAERLARLVDSGIDPVQAEKDAQAEKERAEERAQTLTVKALSARFVQAMEHQHPRSKDFIDATMRLHVLPVIGDRPLPDLKRADVNEVLDRIEPTRLALRRNTFAVMQWLAKWATNDRGTFDNPLRGMEPPPMAKARDRVLSDDELRLIWLAADNVPNPWGTFYRLALLTAQRRNEVAALDWSELDRREAVWHLPGTRSKNGEANIVPLSAEAVAVLDDLAGGDKWPLRGLAFTTTGTTPLSAFSKAKVKLDTEMAVERAREAGDAEPVAIKPWRIHDLRRTCATGLQRLGIRFEVTEAVLNHLSGSRSGVAGIYQRHNWKEEKRTALEAWGRDVMRAVAGKPRESGGNVVPLKKSAAKGGR